MVQLSRKRVDYYFAAIPGSSGDRVLTGRMTDAMQAAYANSINARFRVTHSDSVIDLPLRITCQRDVYAANMREGTQPDARN